jgi:KDO2-lipid IV(A) lauroyltransferase
VRDSLISTAQTAFETPGVWTKDSKHLLTWIDNVYNEDVIDEALSKSSGALLLLPHIGNWELFNAVFAQKGFQLTALFKPPKQRALASIIEKVRMGYGNEMVPTNPRGLVRLFKVLSAGGNVAVLPDQVPESGVFIPFFGFPAYTDRLVHRLTLKTGAVPILVALIRNPRGLFDLHYSAVPELEVEDELRGLRGLNDALEDLVRQFPAQYQWEYKRFKKQPEGANEVYSSD